MVILPDPEQRLMRLALLHSYAHGVYSQQAASIPKAAGSQSSTVLPSP